MDVGERERSEDWFFHGGRARGGGERRGRESESMSRGMSEARVSAARVGELHNDDDAWMLVRQSEREIAERLLSYL